MVRKMIKYTFDLDKILFDTLHAEAELNDRSVAAQLRVILKERFESKWLKNLGVKSANMKQLLKLLKNYWKFGMHM